MADRRLIPSIPSTPGELPTEGPDNGLDKILRFLTTAVGLEGQQPGDFPSALGATASMLPLGRLLSKLRGAPEAIQGAEKAVPAASSLRLPHDISPDISPMDGVSPEEIAKAAKMGADVPKRRTPY